MLVEIDFFKNPNDKFIQHTWCGERGKVMLMSVCMKNPRRISVKRGEKETNLTLADHSGRAICMLCDSEAHV